MASTDKTLRIVVPPAPWTRALEDGTVKGPAGGFEVDANIDNAPDRFVATKDQSIAVGENGVRRLALDILDGGEPLGIPVFFGRELMQRNWLVKEDSPLAGIADLAGKRLGSRLSVFSGTGIGALCVMEQVYGVDLGGIEWHMGDPTRLLSNRMGLKLFPGPDTDEANLARLRNGEIDAMMITTGPRYWSLFGGEKDGAVVSKAEGVRVLVDDPVQIAATYRTSRLYPITDVAVVSPAIGADTDLTKQIVAAVSEANRLASRYREADEEGLALREVELLGEDPHQYGFGDNQRDNLAAILGLLDRMGAIKRPIGPEELFVPGTAQ